MVASNEWGDVVAPERVPQRVLDFAAAAVMGFWAVAPILTLIALALARIMDVIFAIAGSLVIFGVLYLPTGIVGAWAIARERPWAPRFGVISLAFFSALPGSLVVDGLRDSFFYIDPTVELTDGMALADLTDTLDPALTRNIVAISVALLLVNVLAIVALARGRVHGWLGGQSGFVRRI